MSKFSNILNNIKEWLSDKTEDHVGAYVLGSYLILFIIGIIIVSFSAGNEPWYEIVLFVIFWPIGVASALLSFIGTILFFVFIVCAIIDVMQKSNN